MDIYTKAFLDGFIVGKAKGKASGGGGALVEKDVNFYDYDGTLLYSYTVAEAQALTALPEAPTHEGLTFQEWNWTLEEIKEHNRELDVGATYITDDGKTRLYINLYSEGMLNVPLNFTQTVSNGVTIDWGDDSAAETVSGTGKLTVTHEYENTGDYVITLNVAAGCTIGLGHSAPSAGLSGTAVLNTVANLRYGKTLRRVEIGNGVSAINGFAFNICKIDSITIPKCITSIGERAFYSCELLKCAVLPRGIVYAPDNLFYNCYTIRKIVLPNTLTSFGSYSFAYTYELDKIVLPDCITTLPKNAFIYSSARKLVLPKRLTSIGDFAFRYMFYIESLVLPSGITTLPQCVVQGCRALINFVIPDGVTSIASNSINCEILESLVIPNSVTEIGVSAFSSNRSLVNIVLPENLTTIGESCFYGCNALVNISIPRGVTSIPSELFQNCNSLKICDFTKHTAVPTLSGTNAFNNTHSDLQIRVPAALYDEWIAATNWSSLASKIVAV